jgi:hypothetical protein
MTAQSYGEPQPLITGAGQLSPTKVHDKRPSLPEMLKELSTPRSYYKDHISLRIIQRILSLATDL